MATGFVSSGFIENILRMVPKAEPEPEERADEITAKCSRFPRLTVWVKHFSQNIVVTLTTSLLAIGFSLGNFVNTYYASPPENYRVLVFGLLVIACFGILVIERMLSFPRPRTWPYLSESVGLTRVVLSILLLATIALLVSVSFPVSSIVLLNVASALIFLVALEYLLRAITALGSSSGKAMPYFLTRSLLALLYRWPPRPLAFLLERLQCQFGIDLHQLQTFRIISRRFLPVSSVVVLFGWLFSGVTQIPLQQRGIYERFGRPVEVLQPGLHMGLMWPFGRVITVENGAVHEQQLSDITENSRPELLTDTAEGPAPQSTWRLWDNNHVTDQSQVIASIASNNQSLQVVNMDIRLIWRVGVRDQDALNSEYQTDGLPGMIRSIARQVLVSEFATKQLDELLGEQRVELALNLNRQIQKRLDALHSGVELLFTRVEAIHPPVGAANAYHGVQAAQIAATALIAREKGYAARVVSDAQRNALIRLNDAHAFSHENLARADSAAIQFNAERDAWRVAGTAFITERRYSLITQSMAQTPLLIIDSHLQGRNASVLDLRQYPLLFDRIESQKVSTK
ncbi:TPA: protease modulator HflK [Salmonella enterica]